MNFINKLSFIILGISIISCSGSDTYQGNWKALDNEGNKILINFQPKQMTFNKDKTYSYTQSSVQYSNGVKTYGIDLGDGRKYLIHFPFSNDDSKAIIKDEYENILYVMSRNKYISQEDLYSLD